MMQLGLPPVGIHPQVWSFAARLPVYIALLYKQYSYSVSEKIKKKDGANFMRSKNRFTHILCSIVRPPVRAAKGLSMYIYHKTVLQKASYISAVKLDKSFISCKLPVLALLFHTHVTNYSHEKKHGTHMNIIFKKRSNTY